MGITLIVTSQLSREIEKKDDKRPKVRELNFNTIYSELFSDIWLLYRAAYYDNGADPTVIELISNDEIYKFY